MLVKDKGHIHRHPAAPGCHRATVMRIFFITARASLHRGHARRSHVGLLVCANIRHLRAFIGWLTDTELFAPEL
jgi:lipoprotein-releasing system permease protein